MRAKFNCLSLARQAAIGENSGSSVKARATKKPFLVYALRLDRLSTPPITDVQETDSAYYPKMVAMTDHMANCNYYQVSRAISAAFAFAFVASDGLAKRLPSSGLGDPSY